MKLKTFVLSAGVSLLLALGAQAITVNVAYDTGTINTTSGLTGFATTGGDMDGMNVTAFFSDSSSQSLLWADTSSSSGGVSGTGWSLNQSGDTFGNDWTLVNTRTTRLVRLLIDAGSGDSVFDISASGSTAGSANGWTFDFQSISAADNGDTITATYRDAVALTASAPVGDLFRYLDITLNDGLSQNSTLKYIADTDNIEFAGDITPVPEPMSTFAGLALALCGMGIFARRLRLA